ncbi:hypothetical protein [Archangium violaceum]|uniref:hypothetical protein n=1 Tax=Archangium violaceum TaxID=83451 RepID=UPI001EF71748
MLRHRLPHSGFRLTYCHNATLGRRDFYRQLCLALGLKPARGGQWRPARHGQADHRRAARGCS